MIKKFIFALCTALSIVPAQSQSPVVDPYPVERCVSDSCGVAAPVIIKTTPKDCPAKVPATHYGEGLRYAVIYYGCGGDFKEFLHQEFDYEHKGQRIIIQGMCFSGCTIFLHNPRLCAEPNAQFGFHTGSFVDAKGRKTKTQKGLPSTYFDKAGFMMYPVPVQEWIIRHGGETDEFIVLKGAEMRAIVRQCSPSDYETPGKPETSPQPGAH